MQRCETGKFSNKIQTHSETMKIHNNDYISTFAYESIQNCDVYMQYYMYICLMYIFLSETH